MKKLSAPEIKTALALVPDWKKRDAHTITRQEQFVLDMASAVNDAIKTESNDLGPGVTYLLATTKNLSPKQIQMLANDRYQMYITGYTPLKVQGLNSNLWEFDLFLTADEFSEIRSKMNKLVEARNSVVRSKSLKAAWTQLLKAHAGSLSDEEVLEKTIGETEQMVFGLPGTSDFLKIRIQDLDDLAKIDNIALTKWASLIENKLKRLDQIYGNINGLWDEYSFLSNNKDRYFYIPQSLLP